MTDVRNSRKAVALILCLTVWHMCAVASFAREIGPAASASAQAFSSPLTALLAGGQTGISRISLSGQPRAVAGSIGQVSWTKLPSQTPAWACRTGAGSVSLDLQQAGKVSILDNSNADIRVAGEVLVVNLVRGSVLVEGTAAARVRVETFDGSYLLGETQSFRTRFTWRAGELTFTGEPGRRVERMTTPALQVSPASERFPLVNGKPATVGFRVVDSAGEPVAGVPVQFTASATGSKVSFSGAPSAVVLTDANGVATTVATALGAAPVAIGGAVAGTQAAASAPADVDRTTGGQKWVAVAVLGALAVATVVLVVVARGKDDPELNPGTATRVAP